MSNDFQIRIAPNGNALRVEAFGKGLSLAGEFFTRAEPSINQDELDQLRSGEAEPELVSRVAEEVSQWLLESDLNFLLKEAVKRKVRIVFNVARDVRAKLSEVPIEMVALKGAGLPLLINDKVDGLVHLLGNVSSAPGSPTAHEWPLRVLIVRTNPTDLGGGVPLGEPIRDEILKLGAEIAPDLVHVDLLSRETGQPATWLALQEQLRKASYDIMVYLGHGDLVEGFDVDVQPVLQFETEDDVDKEHVSPKQFVGVLHNHPVPVIILAGCVTAAEVNPAFKAQIEPLRPRWMQGNQGMAQALVDSGDSRVQLAVGMRYKIESDDAKTFLKSFFRSLLQDKRGNVEAAVRAGRLDLHAGNAHSSGWSAPMVFSKLSREPIFGFLANQPKSTVGHELIEERERVQKIRDTFWQSLMELPSRATLPDVVLHNFEKTLEGVEEELKAKLLIHGPLLTAKRVDARPDGTIPSIPVTLYGPLNVRMLKGKVVIGSEGATITKIEPRAVVTTNGYEWLANLTGNEATFRIERAAGASPLPDGKLELFDIHVTVGPAVPARYLVSVEITTTEPKRTVWGGNNAIIVPRP